MNLQAEEIGGFFVSEKRKAVWATELDMVKKFVEICDKYHFKYVASGGTLIGVVRHKGFIPWDDDVDIMMPRNDYERFLEIAQAELGGGCFLQCNRTEKKYPTGHAQIRNNETACLRAGEYEVLRDGKNCGIFIDIFPYDLIPDDGQARVKLGKKIAFLQKMCNMKVYPQSRSRLKFIAKKLIAGIYFLFHSLEKTIEKINLLCANSTHGCETHTVGLLSFAPLYEKNVWEKAWFDETELHDFEDMQIAIPKRWHEVLEKEFGDYMKIPEDLNGSMHGKCYFDTQTSYTAYKNRTRKQIIELCGNAVL